jgi:hypothetical protein
MSNNPAFMLHEGRGELELPKLIETDYPDPDEAMRPMITINLEAMPWIEETSACV